MSEPERRYYRCHQCDASFTRKDALNRHTNRVHSSNAQQGFTCGLCKKSYTTATNLRRHVCRGSAGNANRTLIRVAEFEDETSHFPGETEQPLGMILHRAWDSIKSGLRAHRFVNILNCRLYRCEGDATPDSPWNALERVWEMNDCGMKLNCSIGCILRHNTEGTYRYYHSSSNNASLFSETKTIMRKVELERAYSEYENMNIREDAAQQDQTHRGRWLLLQM